MVRVSSFTEAGGHAHNEDSFVTFYHPLDATCPVGVVADGQGGQPRGGPAARLACRAATDVIKKLPLAKLTAAPAWSGLLRAVDEAVRVDPAAGYTTFVGLCVAGD